MNGARVVVVGAGLAGLAAAVSLTDAGADVLLLERSRLLGGKATSFRLHDVEVDNGQHVVLRCCTEFIDFARSLGMGHTLRFQRRFDVTVLARGAAPSHLRALPLPAPLHVAASFLRYPHLSPARKARVLRALLAARTTRAPDTTMAAWLQRHGQDAATRRAFWDPFLVPALNASLDDVSARDGVFVIRTAFLGARDAACIGWSTVPLVRLAERAAERCTEVRLRAPVTGIVDDGDRVVAVQLHGGETVPCDACVLAVPPRRAAAILGDPSRAGVRGLDAFTAEPIVDVHLWYDRALPGFEFAALLDSPVQWVFAKGPGYLCCSVSAAAAVVAQPEDELVARCDAEVRAAIPALRGASLTRSACTRDAEATFVPAPGLMRPGARTGLANLTLAGAWTDTGWPATMESAVRSGREAARVLRAQMRTPAPAAARALEVAHAV